jgi:ankyrin repeat protein
MASDLHVAARTGNVEGVLAQLAAGTRVDTTNSSGDTALHDACMWGASKCVSTLLNAGADPNARTSYWKDTPLHNAVRSGCMECLFALIDAGAALDASNLEGCTPLWYAVRVRNPDAMQALIDAGANVHVRDKHAASILSECARYPSSDEGVACARILLDRGVRVDTEDERGATALFTAVSRGDTKLASFLIECGANVNHAEHDGNTPLIWAVRWGNATMTRLLLGACANVRATNKEGETPFIAAQLAKHSECIRLVAEALREEPAQPTLG